LQLLYNEKDGCGAAGAAHGIKRKVDKHMITAQDIREMTFEKARIGGYDMASVDDFLEELADDITASQKENAVLKSKMKVLVDKIEEYRANEEALNMAVLSAQKLAVQIETDARNRAAAMLADAEKQVKTTVGSIEERAAAEEKRLEDAKAATAQFLETVRKMCNTQVANIEAIAAGVAPKQAPQAQASQADSVDEAVRSIENSASRIQADPSIQIDISPVREASDAQARSRNFENTQPFSL
jgi:cell division initiation protein